MKKAAFVEKYGSVKVVCVGFEEMAYVFKAVWEDGTALLCWYGGSADSLDGFSAKVGETTLSVAELDPVRGQVRSPLGDKIDEFVDEFSIYA
jgi:hypothetical protein